MEIRKNEKGEVTQRSVLGVMYVPLVRGKEEL